MENYDQGDLTDVVRSYGGHSSSSQSQPPNSDNPMLFSSAMEESRIWNFGNPLSNIQDPFLHNDELNNIPCSSSFNGRNNSGQVFISSSSGAGFGGASSIILSQKILEDDMLMRRRSMPCNNNIFSNMIQTSPKAKLPLSPCSSPAAVVMAPLPGGIYKASDMVSGSVINANSSKDCLVDNTGVQISSRNLGIKGRKSKVKKVVCIPAPATGNSSQSKGGEVAPSDLWAWRKYGQKPIKGSPYPRGYYRCSSSKGCSARKQVERSRADPNMLVITYTSEHNHPWPTQRNALAGSTRNSHTSSSSKNHNSEIISQNPKEEEDRSPVVASNNSVKEEIMEDIEKQQQLENMDEEEFSERNQSEDLFAELGEIGFTGQDFSARNNVLRDFSKALDPFHLFDWSADETTNTNLF